MSNPDQDTNHSVRRVGAKNRKTRIPPAGRLFPSEALDRSDQVGAVSKEEDITSDPQSTVIITPPEERFPPVAPPLPKKNRSRESRSAVNARPRSSEPMADRHQQRKRRAARQNRIAFMFTVATIGLIAYIAYVWQNPTSPLNPFAPPVIVRYATVTPSAQETQFTARVVYDANVTDCDQFTIAGSISDASKRYAVRVGDLQTLDEGVLTGMVAGYGENAYQFNLSPDSPRYTVQLFDTEGVTRSAPVEVDGRSGCIAKVDFVPSEGG